MQRLLAAKHDQSLPCWALFDVASSDQRVGMEFTDSQNVLHEATLVDAITSASALTCLSQTPCSCLCCTPTTRPSTMAVNIHGRAWWKITSPGDLPTQMGRNGKWTLGAPDGGVGVDVSGPPTCVDPGLLDSDMFCPIFEPVCGCDGVTYSNSCVATYSGVTSWEDGLALSSNTADAPTNGRAILTFRGSG